MTTMLRRVGMGAIAALLVPGVAQAVDLTGIWVGEQHCERFNGEKYQTTFANDVMVVSQDGGNVHMAALLVDDGFVLLFEGRVIDDQKHPDHKGEATFTECLTTPGSPYQEMLRANRIDTKPGPKKGKKDDGKEGPEFNGESIFSQVVADIPDHGTCKWKYRRVSTEDVGVPGCDEVSAPTAVQTSTTHRR